jgi:hypothetical protein
MKTGKVTAISIVLSAVLLAPMVVRADTDGDAWKATVEDRIRVLEDKLAASEVTIAAQRELIGASATPAVSQGSGLDEFFSGLEWGGFVAASYLYNFNNPDGNGAAQPYFQFNTDQNTFSFDAAKLEIGKPASEPGSAGFQLDLLLGENAEILSAGGSLVATPDGRTAAARAQGDTGFFVQEAYVAYNYNGVNLQLGKWETLLGFELLDSPYNPNITHGILFTYAIPLFHTGLLASGMMGENVEWALGVVNGFNNASDYGDNKGVTGRLGWSEDNWSVALNAFVGAEQTRTRNSTGAVIGDNNDRMQIYDLVATFSPDERTDLWLNVDYGFEEFSRDIPGGVVSAVEDAEWKGAALGAAYEISDKLSLALRGEWFRDDGGTRLLGCSAVPTAAAPPCAPLPQGQEIDVVSATATLGYKLTNSLLARLEYRHDHFDGRGAEDALGSDFPKHDANFDDQQDIGIVEVSYTFD